MSVKGINLGMDKDLMIEKKGTCVRHLRNESNETMYKKIP